MFPSAFVDGGEEADDFIAVRPIVGEVGEGAEGSDKDDADDEFYDVHGFIIVLIVDFV